MALYIWRFCTSIRLALALILIIIVLGLVSIFLVQAPTGIYTGSPEYTGWLESVVRPDFGIWTDTLAFFGLFDVFHSPLFLGVGTLLMVNILCCTINRWRSVISVLRGGSIPTNPDYYKKAPLIFTSLSPANTVVLSLTNILLRNRYRVRSRESEGHFFIAADRYAFSRLGTFISHLSLIVLVLGFLLGSFLGFRNDIFVVAEGTVREVGYDTGLSLGLLSFAVDYWPDGIPRDYRSQVIVYQDGRQTAEDVIRVNHPLTYSGVRFYQSFFGPAAVMKVQTTDGVEIADSTVALIGMMEAEPFQRPLGKLDLPGTGMTAYLVLPATNPPDPILAQNQLGLEIYQADATVPLNWAILDEGIPQEMEDLEFTYLEKRYFSGFSVKYDPGTWLVWLACGLFCVGISMVLYLPYRQIRIMVKPGKEGNEIYIRSSGRRGLSVSTELDELGGEIKSLLPGSSVDETSEVRNDG